MRGGAGISLPQIQAALSQPRPQADAWVEPSRSIDEESVIIERCCSLHFQNPRTERYFARWQIENSWYSIVLLMLFLICESINVLFIVAWSPWDGRRNLHLTPDPVTSPLYFLATVLSVMTIPIAVVTLLCGTYGCPTRTSCASAIAALRARMSTNRLLRATWDELIARDGNIDAVGAAGGRRQRSCCARWCSTWLRVSRLWCSTWLRVRRMYGCTPIFTATAWFVLVSGYMRERVHPDGPKRELLPHRAFKCIPYHIFFSSVVHFSVLLRCAARVLFTCLKAWFAYFEASRAATWVQTCPDFPPPAQSLARAVAAHTPPDPHSELTVRVL